MKCQVCRAESGKYPLCRHCNELKEQGIVIKCDRCHKWHYKDAPCPENTNPEPSIQSTQQTTDPMFPGCSEQYLYDLKPLMTKMEQDFYHAILMAIPQEFHLYPQVNLATFIRRTDEAHYQNELYRNVDFLVTNSEYIPKLVIEINDRTHLDRKRQERDAKVHNILEEAGIPLLTLWTSYGINQSYIVGKVAELLQTPVSRKHHFASEKKETPQISNVQTVLQESDTPSVKKGCYIATCVYGSYDCAPVWTLRRFRDQTLSRTWYGRAFIRLYYAVSPTLVKWFGNVQFIKAVWKTVLDKFVCHLHNKGYKDQYYSDDSL